ncbi:hypothetical protein PanWU01x14_176990 [Parasponia andersonii]|uniref:Uncharacterized protein n=1 Tax=Parasponia andersonii TaxID=3476 RepID=A0A2P5C7F3_PARAD|nr:hypothetical protein PanWU01x14_176990 [Parasponia andersonii]
MTAGVAVVVDMGRVMTWREDVGLGVQQGSEFGSAGYEWPVRYHCSTAFGVSHLPFGKRDSQNDRTRECDLRFPENLREGRFCWKMMRETIESFWFEEWEIRERERGSIYIYINK